MTDSLNKVRAVWLALQDVEAAKGVSKEEVRESLAADGFGRSDVSSLFAEVLAEAAPLAAKKVLAAARTRRLAASSTSNVLEAVRGLALADGVLRARIQRFESMGAQIAHRDITEVTREDLESQYADLLIAAGIGHPNDDGTSS